MAERMKALERENRELRQANEILRKASAYLAMAELRGRRICEARMGLTCHGIFPPSAIRVRPMERTDDEEWPAAGFMDTKIRS
jgi:hypothetical protein